MLVVSDFTRSDSLPILLFGIGRTETQFYEGTDRSRPQASEIRPSGGTFRRDVQWGTAPVAITGVFDFANTTFENRWLQKKEFWE